MQIQTSHYNKLKNHKVRLKYNLSNIKESHIRFNVNHIISFEYKKRCRANKAYQSMTTYYNLLKISMYPFNVSISLHVKTIGLTIYIEHLQHYLLIIISFRIQNSHIIPIKIMIATYPMIYDNRMSGCNSI